MNKTKNTDYEKDDWEMGADWYTPVMGLLFSANSKIWPQQYFIALSERRFGLGASGL